MITFLVSLFYAGTFLLVCAIAVNAVIKYFNIMNWYELLNHLKSRKWPNNIKFIDVIWLFGYGWPKDKGGLMYYADTIGAKSILKCLQKLAEDDHELVISELLIKMAQNDDKFLDINTGGLIAT